MVVVFYRWIDLLALQIGHVDLEVPERILGQPNFIRWGPPSDIHGVGLPHHGGDRPGVGPNPRSVKGTTRGIDVESSKDLGGGGIKSENNLNTTVGVLG